MPETVPQEEFQIADKLQKAQHDLAAASAEIDSLRKTSASMHARVDSLQSQVDRRDAEMRGICAELAHAKALHVGMTSSLSWRLTSVLRRMKALFAARPDSGSPVRRVKSPLDGAQFDADFYLNAYPDVRALYSNDPYEHFLNFGKAEGRLGVQPEFRHSGSFERLDPDRPTVLVVSHEASTTGAPVLSLNVILELKSRYNVIAMVIKGGSLSVDLEAAADMVVGPIGSHSRIVVQSQIDQLLSRCAVRFAIVNSIESASVLPELARHFIPTVALIHEFASNTRPRNAIPDAIFWASETVFSAGIVRENALTMFPELALRPPAVIPQGRCARALTSPSEELSNREKGRIERTFRPPEWPADAPVVLGVGFVHIRKGVDLFVACAARVAQEVRCRFIWIGGGYEPEFDTGYSVYLQDQIERAGLADRFAFMTETSRIDLAYDKADVLVISSRLDPLPNVSIDAASRGIPIVCFDRATGMADILRQNGLSLECVAPYLDVEGLAMRVIAFLNGPELRKQVGAQLQIMAESTFNMKGYVAQIENMALACSDRAAQDAVDCATLAQNPRLNLDYLARPGVSEPQLDEAICRFIRSWNNGLSLRKPYAGFHPGIYQEQCGISSLAANPLAHYMRAGSPAGPWAYDVIDAATENGNDSTSVSNLSVALHLHVFYPDLAPAIIDRLNANTVRPDLFISLSSRAMKDEVKALFRNYQGRTIDIQVVPNRGRDIGAFLTAFADRMASSYEFIGHFHTKKTAELMDRSMGQKWFAFLLENLIGGRHKMADVILRRMSADPTIGLVFPDDPHVVGWSNNHEIARRLMERMGLPDPQQSYFNFPVGTMFWARSGALRSLFALNLTWDDYPLEPASADGTILHALERLLPFVTAASSFRSVVTSVPGVTR